MEEVGFCVCMMKALVIRNTGSAYTVRTADGQTLNCKVKGNFRLKGLRTTNPVAVGDVVEISADYITAVEPRRNYIIRRASNLSKESHIIAANIDMAALVVSLFHPATSTTFIDRFLATAEAYGVKPLVVINKVDLCEGEPERMELLEAVTYLYRSIGYDVVHTSADTGAGVPELLERLNGLTTLFSGNSGVGKTTLINCLIPGLDLRTGEISSTHLTGMHTTTFSEMFSLPAPYTGSIIDTPGVKGFGTIDFAPSEVSHYFPEIFKAGRSCRYADCTHTIEPGCNVLHELGEHRIAQSRYNSYLSILSDAAPDKYRKPF